MRLQNDKQKMLSQNTEFTTDQIVDERTKHKLKIIRKFF